MEIFGVGPGELLFFLVILLIVIGPRDLAKTSRTLGRWLNRFIQSDTWKLLRGISQQVSHLPYQLMREANLDEALTSQGQTIAPPRDRLSGTAIHPTPPPAEASRDVSPTPGVPVPPPLPPTPSPTGRNSTPVAPPADTRTDTPPSSP